MYLKRYCRSDLAANTTGTISSGNLNACNETLAATIRVTCIVSAAVPAPQQLK